MQTRTPEHLRGRVMGVVTSSEYAAGPAGFLLGGPLVDALGVRPAFLVLTGALFVVALAAVPARGLRALDDPPRYAASPDQPLHGPPHQPVPYGDHP